MTQRATRVVSLVAAGALTLGAAAAWACENKSTKTASASSCGVKSTTVATAKAPATVTSRKATPVRATKAPAATAAKKAAPAVAGMRVQRDPETGELTVAPGLKVIGADGLPLSEGIPTDLPQTPLARGGYTIDLQGFGQEYSTLQLDAHGHRHFKCTTHPRATLKSAAVAPVLVDRSEK